MGNKWSTTAITGYKANTPTDDGAETAANQVKYNSIITNLTDPLNSSLTVVIGKLDALFSNTTATKSGSYTTTNSDHARVIEVTGSNTITLLAAATAGAAYTVTVKNAGAGAVTVSRDSTDTINGATSITLAPGQAMGFIVNAAGDGYDFLSFGREGKVFLSSQTASASASLNFTLDTTNYSAFELILENIKPATDAAAIYLRGMVSGTPTITGYSWNRQNRTHALTPTVSDGGDDTDSEIEILNAVGNQDGEQAVGSVRIVSVGSMGFRVHFALSADNGSGLKYGADGTGVHAGTAFDGVQILASSGNLTSGVARLYGYKKA